MPARIDVTGQRFGRLIVLGDAPKKSGERRKVVCACDCGAEIVCEPRQLTRGKTRSCGCLQKEAVAKTAATNITHGMAGTVEYNTWVKIKSRCLNPKNAKYADYGGRGIKICEAWKDSFEQFLADMGKRPRGKQSIDRIDVNADYSPENCRWANHKEQARNKRSHRMVVYEGTEMPLSQACELSGGDCVYVNLIDPVNV